MRLCLSLRLLAAALLGAVVPARAEPLSAADREAARLLLLSGRTRVHDLKALDYDDPYLALALPHMRARDAALAPASVFGGGGVSFGLPWPGGAALRVGYLPGGTFTTGTAKNPALYVLDSEGRAVEQIFLLEDGRLVRVPHSPALNDFGDRGLRVEAVAGGFELVEPGDPPRRARTSGAAILASELGTGSREAEELSDWARENAAKLRREEPAADPEPRESDADPFAPGRSDEPARPAQTTRVAFGGDDEVLDPPGMAPGLYRRTDSGWTKIGYRFQDDGRNYVFRYGNNAVVGGRLAHRQGSLIDPRDASRGIYDVARIYRTDGVEAANLDRFNSGAPGPVWDPATRRWQTLRLIPDGPRRYRDLNGTAYVRRSDNVVVSAGEASAVAGAVPDPAAPRPSARRLLYFDPATGHLVNAEGRLLGQAQGRPDISEGSLASDLSLKMADGTRISWDLESGRLGPCCGGTLADVRVGLPPGMHYEFNLETRRTQKGRGYTHTLGWSATLARGEPLELTVELSQGGATVVSAPGHVDGARLTFFAAGEGRFRSENGTLWLIREGDAAEPRWVAKRFVQTPVERRCERCRLVQLHEGRWVEDPSIVVRAARPYYEEPPARPLARVAPPAGERRLLFAAGNDLGWAPTAAAETSPFTADQTRSILQTNSTQGDFFYRRALPLKDQVEAAAYVLASLDSVESRRWYMDALLANAAALEDYAEEHRDLPFTVAELEQGVHERLKADLARRHGTRIPALRDASASEVADWFLGPRPARREPVYLARGSIASQDEADPGTLLGVRRSFPGGPQTYSVSAVWLADGNRYPGLGFDELHAPREGLRLDNFPAWLSTPDSDSRRFAAASAGRFAELARGLSKPKVQALWRAYVATAFIEPEWNRAFSGAVLAELRQAHSPVYEQVAGSPLARL